MLRYTLATGVLVASAVVPMAVLAQPAHAAVATQAARPTSTATDGDDCWWRKGCMYCRENGEAVRITCSEGRRERERGLVETKRERARHRARLERERYLHGGYRAREREEHRRRAERHRERYLQGIERQRRERERTRAENRRRAERAREEYYATHPHHRR
ncbi:hypothetical protein [Microtetraspora glauca]|uniref:Uncharacterized protein n=1 Tax=Microtetraspora glauca TaxID=1996 RepID=A0ABV3GE99_MICGL